MPLGSLDLARLDEHLGHRDPKSEGLQGVCHLAVDQLAHQQDERQALHHVVVLHAQRVGVLAVLEVVEVGLDGPALLVQGEDLLGGCPYSFVKP